MNVYIRLMKMHESSGNDQFFVYAIDKDKYQDIFSNVGTLNFSCYQSKHYDFKNNDPIKRASYDCIQLLKFFGKTRSDLDILGLTEDEIKLFDESFRFWRID